MVAVIMRVLPEQIADVLRASLACVGGVAPVATGADGIGAKANELQCPGEVIARANDFQFSVMHMNLPILDIVAAS